jgi:putative intracellular protease/amidase
VLEAAHDQECRESTLELISAGKRVYSICSGALLLAEYGVLGNEPVAMHHAKTDQLENSMGRQPRTGVPGTGLVIGDWLTSIGGEPDAPYVKSVEIAFQILADHCPETITYVAERMEIRPHHIDLVHP